MTDLSNVTPLLLPWAEDVWGGMRPPVSVEAAQMSAALAYATYGMEVEPWLRAGWRDATILVDGELTAVRRHEGWLGKTLRERRVKAQLQQHGALGEVLGTLRHAGESATCKALVMAHPAPEGRWVVAVSFMGTGARFYDWISNFRMTTQEGVHRGFLQLTRQFECCEERIQFPETARTLGARKLTLGDVLREMQHPGSRFVLWLTGHSQGAALMQLYAHRKIHGAGVLARNMVGYGFAAPSVMTGTATPNPAAYPLYHVQNSDDVVTRCGAQVHLGVCLTYPADNELRQRCYPWPEDALSVQARACVGPILRRMTDSAACIESAIACLNVISRGSAADIWHVLGLSGSFPLGRMVTAAEVDRLVRSARRHAAMAHQSITGQPLDQARVADFMVDIEAAVAQVGLPAFGAALRQLTGAPHSIAPSGVYQYIAENGMERLIPTCWQAGNPPVRILGLQRMTQARVNLQEGTTPLNVRRRRTAQRRVHRGLRYRDPRPRTDTRHCTPVLERGAMRAGEKLLRTKER